MKRSKLYLPFEIDFIRSDMHSELLECYGAQGLGIYFMVLMELCNHEDYRCRLSTIKGAARRCLADPEILESVLLDFALFEFHRCGDRILISSVYLSRVMQPFKDKTRSFSSTANEKTVAVERPVYGMSTVDTAEIINKTKIKTKTTTNKKAATAAKAVAAAVVDVMHEVKSQSTTPRPARSREEHLAKAPAGTSRMEMLSIFAGVHKLLAKHRQLVIAGLRRHMLSQGAGSLPHSASASQGYLSGDSSP